VHPAKPAAGGLRIVSISGQNPNVCHDCDALLIDDLLLGIALETFSNWGNDGKVDVRELSNNSLQGGGSLLLSALLIFGTGLLWLEFVN
jgi:hypothetical protein